MRAKIHRVGNSAGLVVPAALARGIGFEPGTLWNVCLRDGGPFFLAEARRLSNSVGILIPVPVLREHGVKVGDELSVPFGVWVPAKTP